ncbi:hypothetical protein BD770DRAFT_380536 [Pilaira anomala]|nr:hypothetical protein BD770DRAFT_380536 [Pilaira anomala]
MEPDKEELIELDEEVYEVESLKGHRKALYDKNQIEYLIKWKDYADEYNSWEKEVDIFSKNLVDDYWRKQPYTLEDFRNGTHKKKVKLSSSNKKRPVPSAVMLEVEKKQKLNDIKSAKLTAEPPTGLTWNDIDSIKNIFHCGTETYFAEVKWTKTDTVSFIPIRLLRKFNPLKLIYFYESVLDFNCKGKSR